MTTPPHPATDEATQIACFSDAVALLGGARQTARVMGCAESTIRQLLEGRRALHPGWLTDIARALTTHADLCRTVERRLNPLFLANLTVEQQRAKPDGRGSPRHARKAR